MFPLSVTKASFRTPRRALFDRPLPISYVLTFATAVFSTIIATFYRERTLRLQKKTQELASREINTRLPTVIKETLCIFFKKQYSPPKFSQTEYIKRPKLDSKIKLYKDTMIKNEKFIIVVGQHGIGKTFSLNYCLYGARAIIHIVVDQPTSYAEIGWLILTEGCSIYTTVLGHISPIKIFEDACREFTIEESYYPTLIIDITPSVDSETFSAVIMIARRLVCESKCCNMFITVSSTILSLMPLQELRIEFLFFPPLSTDEINSFLESSTTRMPELEAQFLQKKLGSTPYELKLIAGLDISLNVIIEESKLNYISNLMNSLLEIGESKSPIGMLRVFELLVTKSFDEGAKTSEILAVSNMSLKDIGYYIRSYQVLDYNPGETGRFSFAGTFYFRNQIIYEAAVTLLNDAKFNQFIRFIKSTGSKYSSRREVVQHAQVYNKSRKNTKK